MDLTKPLGKKIRFDNGTQSYYTHEDLLSSDMQDFFGIFVFDVNSVEIDETPEMFETFVQWLYTRHFFKTPSVKVALELWVFAGKIWCEELQNYTMDFIQDYYTENGYMGVEELKYVFKATKDEMHDYLLRKFCAAALHYQNSPENTLVREILLKVPAAVGPYLYYESAYHAITKLEDRDPSLRTASNLCRFHHHSISGEVCKSQPNNS